MLKASSISDQKPDHKIESKKTELHCGKVVLGAVCTFFGIKGTLGFGGFSLFWGGYGAIQLLDPQSKEQVFVPYLFGISALSGVGCALSWMLTKYGIRQIKEGMFGENS